MEKAWSVLQNKVFDEDSEFVTVKGMATTPRTDRVGDVVEPMGMKTTGRIKLMMYHNHTLPVGNVTFAKPTSKGIPFEAVIPKVIEPGVIQDRTNEAIHSLKYNLLDAVSIGFSADREKTEVMKNGGLRFKEWEWLELSLVPVPANPDAVIQSAKAYTQSLSAHPPVSRKAHSVKFSPRKPK
jgi:uncharacterized protein